MPAIEVESCRPKGQRIGYNLRKTRTYTWTPIVITTVVMSFSSASHGSLRAWQRAAQPASDCASPFGKVRGVWQAVMGTLMKRLLCRRLGLDPASVYHTAVMPCYDKKLEASRSDFNLPGLHLMRSLSHTHASPASCASCLELTVFSHNASNMHCRGQLCLRQGDLHYCDLPWTQVAR